ncbi:MAG: response regulator [Nitrospirota bacterium]
MIDKLQNRYIAKRILIVDEEPSILSGLSKAINKFCNFHGGIKTVENGKDAIKEISLCFYDICFMDIQLPDLNGLDVMKRVSEISPGTKVAIMTSAAITDDMKKTIEEGASLFIPKPFDFIEIKAVIKQVLGEDAEGIMEERRQFGRKPFKKTIRCSVNVFDRGGGLSKLDMKADIFDISRGGMGIRTDYPLAPGYVLRFDDEDIGHIAGIVKWSMMVSDNYMVNDNYMVGVALM